MCVVSGCVFTHSEQGCRGIPFSQIRLRTHVTQLNPRMLRPFELHEKKPALSKVNDTFIDEADFPPGQIRNVDPGDGEFALEYSTAEAAKKGMGKRIELPDDKCLCHAVPLSKGTGPTVFTHL